MASLAQYNPFSFLLRKTVEAAITLLTKPIARYTLTIPNDLTRLKRNIRKGDVILIEGNERISEVIKYLTQSSWSHSALYVGDEPLKQHPEWAADLTARYGDEAHYLIIEALVDQGVVLSPLAKYLAYNIRICRPFNLTSADQFEVVHQAIACVGRQYDLKNIFDLMRYFLPVSLVPSRLRRQALEFGSTSPTRVICSSLIAELFGHVRFPIVPSYEPLPPDVKLPGQSFLMRRLGRGREGMRRLLRPVSPTFITPRDFDLSPYFAIVKFNTIENARFDYRKLLWIEDRPSAPPVPPADDIEQPA